MGWYTANSGGVQVSASTIMEAGNVTIYAQWSKIPISASTGNLDPDTACAIIDVSEYKYMHVKLVSCGNHTIGNDGTTRNHAIISAKDESGNSVGYEWALFENHSEINTDIIDISNVSTISLYAGTTCQVGSSGAKWNCSNCVAYYCFFNDLSEDTIN